MEEQETNNKYSENYSEEKSNRQDKTGKNITITVIVFIALLFVILGCKFYLDKLMPEHILNQGQKYLEAGQYDKAIKMFESAENKMPFSDEPVYLKAVALAKMPNSFETQKDLYEISQLDDCDKASDYAADVLSKIRRNLEQQIGPNYIDNVLYEDKLVRWNNLEPIKYIITSNFQIPDSYYQDVRNAFSNWQNASNNTIRFEEIQSVDNAQIVVNFAESIPVNNRDSADKIGVVKANIKDSLLSKMDISIKRTNNNNQPLTDNQVTELCQHEIGHALGLWGHSVNDSDVMSYNGDYVYDDNNIKNISQRDINTLLLIYNMIPDVIDKRLTNEQMKNMYYHNILTTYPGENFKAEIQRLIALLSKDKNNIVAWVDLAIKYGYKGQYDRSNYVLNKVLPLTYFDLGNEQVVLYNLAANYYKMRDYKTSEKYLYLATKIKDDLDTQILGSFLDFRLGRIDIAREKLTHLNNVYPDNIEVALKLAEVYYVNNDKENEKLVIERLIEKNPKSLNDRRVRKYHDFIGK